jgi:hypothetical protein
MGERSMSFSLALQDLASLIQKIASAQVVPESVLDDWPEAAEIRRLATVFTKEEAQLFYQIAITSRPDLSLAPMSKPVSRWHFCACWPFGRAVQDQDPVKAQVA